VDGLDGATGSRGKSPGSPQRQAGTNKDLSVRDVRQSLAELTGLMGQMAEARRMVAELLAPQG
jgi:predicted component of type VI protein secretion system